MAEVVGLAASIIQIAGAGTKLSLTLYNFTTSAARAEQDIKDIADDVELTSNALESVGRVFEMEDAKSIISKKAIQDANNIIKKCESVFNEISEMIEKRRKLGKDGKKSLSLMGKLSFPLKEPRIELNRRRLESLKNSLVLLLHVLQLAQGQARGRMEKSVMEEEREKIRELHQRQQDSLRSLQALESKFCKVTLDDEETLQGSITPSRVPTMDIMAIATPVSMPTLEKSTSLATLKTITIDLSVVDDSETSESDATSTDDEDEHLSLEELSKCAKQVQKLLKRITVLQHSFENSRKTAKHRKKRVHKMYQRFCRKFESNIDIAPVPHQKQLSLFDGDNRRYVQDDHKPVILEESYRRIATHGATSYNMEHGSRRSSTSDQSSAHLRRKGRARSDVPAIISQSSLHDPQLIIQPQWNFTEEDALVSFDLYNPITEELPDNFDFDSFLHVDNEQEMFGFQITPLQAATPPLDETPREKEATRKQRSIQSNGEDFEKMDPNGPDIAQPRTETHSGQLSTPYENEKGKAAAATIPTQVPLGHQPQGMPPTYFGPDPAAHGNQALQDHQMQLMLLEQQNKKRLVMARQEHGAGPSDDPKAMSPAENKNSSPPKLANQMKRSEAPQMGMNDDMYEGVETHPATGSAENDPKGSMSQPNSSATESKDQSYSSDAPKVAPITSSVEDLDVSDILSLDELFTENLKRQRRVDDLDFPINSPQFGNENASDSRYSTSAPSDQDDAPLEDVDEAASSAIHYTRTGRISKAKKGRKVHTCECGKSYTSMEHLERHQKTHSAGELNVCEYPGCGKQFYRLDLLRRHQERHDVAEGEQEQSIDNSPPFHLITPMPIPTYYGPQPQPVEASADPANNQQIAAHVTPFNPVSDDGLALIDWDDPFSYSRMNYPSTRYANQVPGLADYANLAVPLLPESYWEEKEKREKYWCEECKESFRTEDKLREHLWLHCKKMEKGEGRWCDECKKQFQSKKEFDEHIWWHFKEKHPDRAKYAGKKLKEFFGEEPIIPQSTTATRSAPPKSMNSSGEVGEKNEDSVPKGSETEHLNAPFVSDIQILDMPWTTHHSTSIAPSGDETGRKRSQDDDKESDEHAGDSSVPQAPAQVQVHVQDSQEAKTARSKKKRTATKKRERDAKEPPVDTLPSPPKPLLSPDALDVSRKRARESDAAGEDGGDLSPKRSRAGSEDVSTILAEQDESEDEDDDDGFKPHKDKIDSRSRNETETETKEEERDIVDILLEQWTVPVY